MDALVKTSKTLLLMAAIFFLSSLPAVAVPSQTYVIHTYGGAALLPAVRQQLNSSPDGGTVATYQDKLVLTTTARNYQMVQQLLMQIDRQPQALTVSVRVGNDDTNQRTIQQGQVIINQRGIQGSGVISQHNSQQQSNNLYQVQTLSGSAASISTGTLYSLTQRYGINSYLAQHPSVHHRLATQPNAQIVIQQQVLLPTTQGIAVTPRLLSDGQIEVRLSQVEEKRVNASIYDQNASVKAQRLNSALIVPRGQWVTIGHISQNSQNQRSSYGSYQDGISGSSVPISLLVQ